MVASFKQKKGLNYRNFDLYDDKILIATKTKTKISSYEVKIEELGSKLHFEKENNKIAKAIIYIFLIMPVIITAAYIKLRNTTLTNIITIDVMSVALFLISFLKQTQDDVFLVGGRKNIVFYRKIPSEEKVLAFIQLIKDTKRRRVISTMNYDDYFPKEMFLLRAKWAKDMEIITAEEFENYKAEFDLKKLL